MRSKDERGRGEREAARPSSSREGGRASCSPARANYQRSPAKIERKRGLDENRSGRRADGAEGKGDVIDLTRSARDGAANFLR